MCELAFAGAFMSLLLTWFNQNQRINLMEGRLLEAEKGEKECLAREVQGREREVKLNLRVSELERVVGVPAPMSRQRASRK